jgi:hypothetical protein
VQLGPAMCVARVPRNGRNFEFSDDGRRADASITSGSVGGVRVENIALHFRAAQRALLEANIKLAEQMWKGLLRLATA